MFSKQDFHIQILCQVIQIMDHKTHHSTKNRVKFRSRAGSCFNAPERTSGKIEKFLKPHFLVEDVFGFDG